MLRWLVYHLVLRPIIVADYERRAELSARERCTGNFATAGDPYPWDKMHWADELAIKWGFFTSGG